MVIGGRIAQLQYKNFIVEIILFTGTAKRILERLGIQTSSSLDKI